MYKGTFNCIVPSKLSVPCYNAVCNISNESLVYDELVRRSVTGHIEIIYETVWKQYRALIKRYLYNYCIKFRPCEIICHDHMFSDSAMCMPNYLQYLQSLNTIYVCFKCFEVFY